MLSKIDHKNLIKVDRYISPQDTDFLVLLPPELLKDFLENLADKKIDLKKLGTNHAILPKAMLLMEYCHRGTLFEIV